MSPPAARTALIVDEHPLWLDALQSLLARLDLTVVARASRRSDAVQLLEQHRPDVVVADLDVISDESTDGPNTCSALLRAREVNAEVKCIVLGDDDPAAVERAFNSGASAFCAKRVEPDDLAAAIRQSFTHSIYFAPRARNGAPPAAITPPAPPGGAVDLTKREAETLRLAAEGYSNAQLAEMLCVTEQTVKFHLSNIYRKLDVTNRTEASRWAERNGLLAVRSTATAA